MLSPSNAFVFNHHLSNPAAYVHVSKLQPAASHRLTALGTIVTAHARWFHGQMAAGPFFRLSMSNPYMRLPHRPANLSLCRSASSLSTPQFHNWFIINPTNASDIPVSGGVTNCLSGTEERWDQFDIIKGRAKLQPTTCMGSTEQRGLRARSWQKRSWHKPPSQWHRHWTCVSQCVEFFIFVVISIATSLGFCFHLVSAAISLMFRTIQWRRQKICRVCWSKEGLTPICASLGRFSAQNDKKKTRVPRPSPVQIAAFAVEDIPKWGINPWAGGRPTSRVPHSLT